MHYGSGIEAGRRLLWTAALRAVLCVFVAGVIRLNGEVGGRGEIKVVGDVGSGDNRVNVVGGTQQFNGVAGKVIVHNKSKSVSKLHFHLVR